MEKIPSNTEQAQITAVGTIHVGVQALLNDVRAKGDKPDLQQDNGEGQARQAQEMAQG